jgi:hydrogenase expression/formation protein HypE
MSGGERIGLRHGAGGPAMRELVRTVFARHAAQPGEDALGLAALDDGAALRVGDRWLVYTTDSHVVKPIFFPGGDIGRLAVSGTVNDLAVMGATAPLGLACAVVLEEGFEHESLLRIQTSIEDACAEADTAVQTGDTKVMGRGELDGVVITTTGFGFADRLLRDDGLRPGDDIVVTGTIGDHGFAVLVERNDLRVEGDLRSDVAPLNGLLAAALSAGGEAVVAMKDPTRGGVAGASGARGVGARGNRRAARGQRGQGAARRAAARDEARDRGATRTSSGARGAAHRPLLRGAPRPRRAGHGVRAAAGGRARRRAAAADLLRGT